MTHAIISPTTPTCGYQLNITIKGTRAPFLVNTDATMTLLQEDVWGEIEYHTQVAGTLVQVPTVGVEGTPLRAYGSTQVTCT